MATYNTTASVTLTVNGRQAQAMLQKLQTEATTLERKIKQASAAGDKASMQRLQRELRTTQGLLTQMQQSTRSVDQVLRRLDTATPRELQRVLRTLQTQVQGLERGSAAWNVHVQKIRQVKAELQRVNATMMAGESLWTRLNNGINRFGTAIMGLTAAVTGLVMAGRKAVSAYADIEEQMANTRKYTGLTTEAVGRLNDTFRKMDTRTSREQLNALAQEAGRLGKNTMESVQGYVEAADIINVALVDLGEGATQTIAKISNIFGVEELLGTRDAMLSVGSTVNVLSQNCTASKPYLVEFAQRMAGIGSQAGMTIPDILALGAVLDANGQKVEMSATAIQKVLMKLAQRSHDLAATLGIDAEQLNETLKHSARDGLLLFLEALQQMGESTGYENATMTLAPAFKEMGLDAARVSQVLSTLAMHLTEVRSQMEVATRAFEEASSATNEYNIFNNTVQASIDKARKRLSELSIELGEKLYPLMRHIYTSSSLMLRVLNTLVTFIGTHRREISLLITTLTAYTVVAKASIVATRTWGAVTATASFLTRTARTALLALRIAYLHLTAQVQRAEAATKLFNRTSKASPWGIALAVLTAVVGALYNYVARMKESREEARRAAAQMREFKASIVDLNDASAAYASKEMTRLRSLYNEATNEARSREERCRAAEKLQRLYPAYFQSLSTEQILVGEARKQYDDLAASIVQAARARAAAAKVEENERHILELEGQQQDLEQRRRKQQAQVAQREQHLEQVGTATLEATREEAMGPGKETTLGRAIQNVVTIHRADKQLEEAQAELSATERELQTTVEKLESLHEANAQLVEQYQLSTAQIEQATAEPITTGQGPTATEEGAEVSLAPEKAWREQQEALARIAYAKGESDYIEYTTRMNQIAVEYYEQMLQHADLSETERMTLEAEYWEATAKYQTDNHKFSIEEQEASYAKEIATAKQRYIDGVYGYETYTEAMERIEIEHLQRLREHYEEGSQERLDVEAKLRDKLLSQRQRHQKEYEAQEQRYAAMKQEFFGDNTTEAEAKYQADLALLQMVYTREVEAAGDNATERLRIEEAFQQAKLALQKHYNILSEKQSRNALQEAVAASVEWLQSDGGRALQGSMESIVSGMSALFTQLSSLMQAELEIQTAAITERYEAEVSAAEGNSYKLSKLEKQKEEEIAKAKNIANRKMFAMQVIQAVAQTATNALNAYGSAAAIPLVGYILAPIAAATAIAAGAVQVAAIKKQQQASEVQGYATGGFTPEGERDKVVGVVHAGEWVASQQLVHNPQTRPLLEALDRAQQHNTLPTIEAQDVSRVILHQSTERVTTTPVVNNSYITTSTSEQEVLRRLVERLEEPFVTVNTITGDLGIQRAQEEYERLLRNKRPKSRRQ